MCGIAGILTKDGSRPARDLLGRMIGQLRHRGPDAFGVDIKPRLQVVKTSEPGGRVAGVKVGSVAELVGKLKEAGAI